MASVDVASGHVSNDDGASRRSCQDSESQLRQSCHIFSEIKVLLVVFRTTTSLLHEDCGDDVAGGGSGFGCWV